jgi:two-component system phosphate regulon sensor histidine kinase PhoR
MLLEHTLNEPGPWSNVSVTLVEDDANPKAASSVSSAPVGAIRATQSLSRAPHWRLATFPRSGSFDDEVSRGVLRYSALLILVFGIVVIAMFLAARSVRRELSLSQLRSDFVASVSHELRTPLSVIRMFAESLSEDWVSEDKRSEYYEVITRESERLTGLINNVLEFSRIESASRNYRRDNADLREIVANLLNRYQYHLKAAHVQLIEELPQEPIHAMVDRQAIEQVLVNLLSNAVKYMGNESERPRNVRVSLVATADRALIRVADTGIGIPESDRIRIFERFWRANDNRVKAVTGSGLGLTLVKHIIEAHDGAISVESNPDRGSTFAISLPLTAQGAGSPS